jgi:hypothetical protein
MSLQENKALVRRFYEEVVSTGAVDRVGEFVAPDYVEVHDGERQRPRSTSLGNTSSDRRRESHRPWVTAAAREPLRSGRRPR